MAPPKALLSTAQVYYGSLMPTRVLDTEDNVGNGRQTNLDWGTFVGKTGSDS